MTTLLHLAALAATILVLSRILPSVRIRTTGTAVLVAIVFSVLNLFLGWLLSFALHALLLIPAVFTLGLVFVIIPFLMNAILLWLTDKLMASFQISALSGLLLSAGAITFVNAFFHAHAFHAAWTGTPSTHGQPRWI